MDIRKPAKRYCRIACFHTKNAAEDCLGEDCPVAFDFVCGLVVPVIVVAEVAAEIIVSVEPDVAVGIIEGVVTLLV